MRPTPEEIDALRQEWTDQYVEVVSDRPDLQRFVGRVGRVVTVNFNGRLLVDFQDGAWYDLPASESHLRRLDREVGRAAFDATTNAAQARPARKS